jgi:hypothetical protein
MSERTVIDTLQVLPIIRYANAWTALVDWLVNNANLFSDTAIRAIHEHLLRSSMNVDEQNIFDATEDLLALLLVLNQHPLEAFHPSEDCPPNSLDHIKELRKRWNLGLRAAHLLQSISRLSSQFPR